MKRFNKRRILDSKNAVVLKQVINFPSKTEMKKIVKATVDDRTKQMIVARSMLAPVIYTCYRMSSLAIECVL